MSKVYKGVKKIGKGLKKVVKRVGKVIKKAAPAIAIAMMFIPGMQGFAAGIGSAIGFTGTAATVVGSAVVQGTIGGITSYANGGKFGKGFARGAVSGAVGAGVGAYGQAAGWSKATTATASGAVKGGIQTGSVRGAVAGAAGGYMGAEYPTIGGSEVVAGAARGAVTGGIMGGSEGAVRGAITGGVRPVVNQAGDAVWNGMKEMATTVRGWFTNNDTTQPVDIAVNSMADTVGTDGNTTQYNVRQQGDSLLVASNDNDVQYFSTGGYVDNDDDPWRTLDTATLAEIGITAIEESVTSTTSPIEASYRLTNSLGHNPEDLAEAINAVEAAPSENRTKLAVTLGERLGSGQGVVFDSKQAVVKADVQTKIVQLRATMPKPSSNLTDGTRVLTPEEQNLDELLASKRAKTMEAPQQSKMTADLDIPDYGGDYYTADDWSGGDSFDTVEVVDDWSGSNLDGSSYYDTNTEMLDAGINPLTPQGEMLAEQNIDGDIGQIEPLDTEQYGSHLQAVRENYEMGSDIPIEGWREGEQKAMSTSSASSGAKSGSSGAKSGGGSKINWSKLFSGLGKAGSAMASSKDDPMPNFESVSIGASISGASGKASVGELGNRWTPVQGVTANQYLAQLLSSLKVA